MFRNNIYAFYLFSAIVQLFDLPVQDSIFRPIYDRSASINCSAYGLKTPNMTLLQHRQTPQNPFKEILLSISITESYGINRGIELTATFADVDVNPTCETVTKYDDTSYQCKAVNQAANGVETKLTNAFSIETECMERKENTIS